VTTIDAEVGGGVLRKAFEVLDTFGPKRQTMSLSDIMRRSGLPKTTTHRVLQQMLSVGIVERDGQNYRVGSRMFAWSSPSREVAVREVALPFMADFNRRHGHTLHLATLCDDDVLYIEKLHSRATAFSPSMVGGRLPAHCTAVGKVLLSYSGRLPSLTLDQGTLTTRTNASISSVGALQKNLLAIREVGYAVDNEEAAAGLRCLAVPIVVGGHAIAAMSIAYSTTVGLPKDRLLGLQEAAARIARAMTGHPGYRAILGCD
jgi:DNA-binding IclR family transcriptional regulator